LVTFKELITDVYFSTRFAIQENDASSTRLSVNDVETPA
jgi:hypothetical protein